MYNVSRFFLNGVLFMSAQTYEFQAQAKQLLNLVINSIYSNKEIFLRELLSNASDALDKLRLASVQDSELNVDTSDLHIEIERDEKERVLKVIDRYEFRRVTGIDRYYCSFWDGGVFG